jgi:hypothetical protein
VPDAKPAPPPISATTISDATTTFKAFEYVSQQKDGAQSIRLLHGY